MSVVLLLLLLLPLRGGIVINKWQVSAAWCSTVPHKAPQATMACMWLVMCF